MRLDRGRRCPLQQHMHVILGPVDLPQVLHLPYQGILHPQKAEEVFLTGLLPGSPHVKLPKLSLKKFSGDLTKLTIFWDTFQSSVHQNPTLTSIDKFSYLNSLLESTAAEVVAGLTLTSANYDEAVSTLKRWFGNKQSIIDRHMELLLHLEAVTSVHNLKGLRQLYDVVESNVRSLKALGVSASSYGRLLSPILMSRLPSDLHLIVSRELSEDEWDVEVVMEMSGERSKLESARLEPQQHRGRSQPHLDLLLQHCH